MWLRQPKNVLVLEGGNVKVLLNKEMEVEHLQEGM